MTHNIYFSIHFIWYRLPALSSNREEAARLFKSKLFIVIGKNFTNFLPRNQFETPYMNSHLGCLETSDLRP